MAENLHKAKKAKNDEFYTLLKDIETEINNYIEYDKDVFRDKVVLCPCDDHNWSNFTKYFVANFDALGLKKLISTSYAKSSGSEKVDDFELNSENYDENKTKEHGKLFVLERDEHGQKGKLEFKGYLEGDGDFRSDEVKKLRDTSDVIVTNPPFSLLIDYVAWLMETDKKFIFWANNNCIACKEIFPLIKENKIWLGGLSNNTCYYKIPDTYEKWDEEYTKKMNDGNHYAKVPAISTFTNIDLAKRHIELTLMTRRENLKYNKKIIKHLERLGLNDYPKYDNYDAIDVKYVSAIPSDYYGVMGVPITFLDKFNPAQFYILGCTQRGCHKNFPDVKKYDNYIEINHKTNKPTGATGIKANENAMLTGKSDKNNYFVNKSTGETVYSMYSRIFIMKKCNNQDENIMIRNFLKNKGVNLDEKYVDDNSSPNMPDLKYKNEDKYLEITKISYYPERSYNPEEYAKKLRNPNLSHEEKVKVMCGITNKKQEEEINNTSDLEYFVKRIRNKNDKYEKKNIDIDLAILFPEEYKKHHLEDMWDEAVEYAYEEFKNSIFKKIYLISIDTYQRPIRIEEILSKEEQDHENNTNN